VNATLSSSGLKLSMRWIILCGARPTRTFWPGQRFRERLPMLRIRALGSSAQLPFRCGSFS